PSLVRDSMPNVDAWDPGEAHERLQDLRTMARDHGGRGAKHSDGLGPAQPSTPVALTPQCVYIALVELDEHRLAIRMISQCLVERQQVPGQTVPQEDDHVTSGDECSTHNGAHGGPHGAPGQQDVLGVSRVELHVPGC